MLHATKAQTASDTYPYARDITALQNSFEQLLNQSGSGKATPLIIASKALQTVQRYNDHSGHITAKMINRLAIQLKLQFFD